MYRTDRIKPLGYVLGILATSVALQQYELPYRVDVRLNDISIVMYSTVYEMFPTLQSINITTVLYGTIIPFCG